ncbi:peptide-methionine (R)-S-oxide reductase MsrB [Henriciella mobilis]|uniref:peptide-methionine (R)-S-oxide reductase n=1 Tax=Henriciella mobilis TaxID=2305467 RepID=A0A399RG16_9PROT|nr:peptide-methionine (R)-S-oxide reductase MsrB [Henriciella mobilis]RIJ14526.1 peptide-methionine (R)-S-oxide reductase [Henriciella mobilis]RIJ19645.1 peptide-methionine (R)-S-oxide reductase [Henriciella mobilis]RIJ28579.1 peptide-methionine (R)-S-oxide reductase [Henriciella mobilis]
MLPPKPADNFKRVSKSEKEWREQLTEEQFRVGVKDGTERAFTSTLNDEKRDGVYHCVGCGTPLWSSEHKFDSGTGWPSFYKPIRETAVDTKRDFKMIMPRTECHCATCGLHMGHVFKDGPPPTGERWCINGVVLDFRPA